MPIKFRCQQCRQFLGISRSKAGSVVDCPTCGRTIRVPDLDGSVKPLPKPSLDLQDSSLEEALNEIASIGGDLDDEEFDAASVSDSDEQVDRFETAAPDGSDRRSTQAEVVPVQPLPPPEPIELAPAEPQRREPPSGDFEEGESADHGWKSTRQGGDSWKRLLQAAELNDESAEAPSKAADPEPVVEQPGTAAKKTVNGAAAETVVPGTAAQPQVVRLAASTWIALAGIAALIFAAGFWAGRMTTLQSGTSADTASTQPDDDSEAEQPGDEPPTEPEDSSPAIRGRITYRTQSGEVKPDKGARIIVLPVQRDGSALIPSAGVQDDSEEGADRELTSTMIRQLGGDFQTTDESGEFSVQLPNAGRFHLLVLSNALPREVGDNIDDIESVVGRYFDRPPTVLGRVQIYLDEVQYSGTGTTPWDHSFQRS